MPRKPKDGKTTVRNHADFEKLTLISPKMSVFMKSKTSSSLPPYYSTEPKKLCSTSHFNYSGARRAPLAVQRWLRNFQFESIIFIIFPAFPAHFWNIWNFQFLSYLGVPAAFFHHILMFWRSWDLWDGIRNRFQKISKKSYFSSCVVKISTLVRGRNHLLAFPGAHLLHALLKSFKPEGKT